jgi:hypothetical protein
MGRGIRILSVLALCCAAMAVGPRSDAAPLPSVRLRATETQEDVVRADGDPIFVDPGVFIAATNGAFELRAKRKTYDDPASVVQVDATTHDVLRRPPATVLDGWNGLAHLLHVTVTDDSNTTYLDESLTFCPDSYDTNRVSSSGPRHPHYPESCSFDPFTKGAVWGIDKGWSVNPFGAAGEVYFDGPDGHYTVSLSIEPLYRALFDISDRRAAATVGIDVTTATSAPSFYAATARRTGHPLTVPTVATPDRSTLPELIAAPAWDIRTAVDSATGDDLLTFGATIWNAGPSPLVVEGYRRPGTEIMDAYQYFFKHGRPVARARVGIMVFDHDVGHEHWHFQQFAEYSLLDANQQLIVPSEKDGFCLAPTDAIDMTRKGAEWRPEDIGFSSACGDIDSTWLREVLPVGWGDTYHQYVPGQSFDITDVPNGTYYVSIRTNPVGKLFERRKTNDTELREVDLGGTPGHRTATVPLWHGIDTESP